MIPRLSLWTVERLRDELMLCALRCKVSKARLLLSALLLGRPAARAASEVMDAPEAMAAGKAARYRAYLARARAGEAGDPLRVREIEGGACSLRAFFVCICYRPPLDAPISHACCWRL